MSIYLYSIRAKMVAVKVGGGTVHANTLEMLHTNWTGMVGDDEVCRAHALKQGSARKYWEGRGLPNLVISGDRLYRWTGENCFWIDTDRIPGEFWGVVTDGVLERHACTTRELYSSKIVCGEPSCRKVLEAFPGEIDAIRAKDAEERRLADAKARGVAAIWAKAREQEAFSQKLACQADDLRCSEKYWEDRIAGLARELEQANGSLAKVSDTKRQAVVASRRADETLNNMRAVARAEEAQLDAQKVEGR